MNLILPIVVLCMIGLFLLYNNIKLSKTLNKVEKERQDFLNNYLKEQDALIQLRVDNEQLLKGTRELQEDLFKIHDELGFERERNKTLLSQKKSSETRLGQISEHLVPFLANCPYDPKNLHFLGNPIDYISFDFDEGAIHFIEIKSGNSKASKRQKIIKNIIKSGRVYYEELRINEKGVKVKKPNEHNHNNQGNNNGQN